MTTTGPKERVARAALVKMNMTPQFLNGTVDAFCDAYGFDELQKDVLKARLNLVGLVDDATDAVFKRLQQAAVDASLDR